VYASSQSTMSLINPKSGSKTTRNFPGKQALSH
jgi:hypothetical protein